MAANLNEYSVIFKTLQFAGQLCPLPGVAAAAVVALSILQEVQTVKTNREAFVAIGRDSCFIVETVVHKVRGQNGRILSDPVILRHIEVLGSDLRYIEKCVKKVKCRSGVRKVFRHQFDQATIRDCRERLTGAMARFGFQNDTEIRRQLASMHNLLFTLLEALSSLRMRSQPQWQTPSASFPPIPSPQTQEPSAPTLLFDLSPDLSTPTSTLNPMASPPVVHRSQERNHLPSPTVSPGGPDWSFQSSHPSSPRAGIGYSYVAGDATDTRRDDSFNVFGTGNNIYLSLAR